MVKKELDVNIKKLNEIKEKMLFEKSLIAILSHSANNWRLERLKIIILTMY